MSTSLKFPGREEKRHQQSFFSASEGAHATERCWKALSPSRPNRLRTTDPYDCRGSYSTAPDMLLLALVFAAQCVWATQYCADVYGVRAEGPPLLFRGAVPASWGEKWGRNNLMRKFGKISIHSTTSKRRIAISSYLSPEQEDEPRHEQLFGASESGEMGPLELFKAVEEDTASLGIGIDVLMHLKARQVLSLGTTRTGSLLHRHEGEAWLGLAVGLKEWLLFPPDHEMTPELEDAPPCEIIDPNPNPNPNLTLTLTLLNFKDALPCESIRKHAAHTCLQRAGEAPPPTCLLLSSCKRFRS